MFIKEEKLSKETKEKLNDSEFGIPSLRKFPLNDENHVRMAIKLFDNCPHKYRQELAENINKKSKEFNIKIQSEDILKYLKEDVSILQEAVAFSYEDVRKCLEASKKVYKKLVDDNKDNPEKSKKLAEKFEKKLERLKGYEANNNYRGIVKEMHQSFVPIAKIVGVIATTATIITIGSKFGWFKKLYEFFYPTKEGIDKVKNVETNNDNNTENNSETDKKNKTEIKKSKKAMLAVGAAAGVYNTATSVVNNTTKNKEMLEKKFISDNTIRYIKTYCDDYIVLVDKTLRELKRNGK